MDYVNELSELEKVLKPLIEERNIFKLKIAHFNADTNEKYSNESDKEWLDRVAKLGMFTMSHNYENSIVESERTTISYPKHRKPDSNSLPDFNLCAKERRIFRK
jgi:hypothetical protein